jgi:hypothetical protein
VAALDRVSAAADADPALVEDLLRAMPHALDEHAAAVAARFVHHASPAVRRAALIALALAHGVGARDRLIAALDDRDDGVRLIAVAMLRQIGAIEAGAIDALGRILSGTGHASQELRAKAAAALADAKDHGAAVAILMHAIEPPKTGVLGAMLRGATRDEAAEVILAAARVLLMLGGDAGRRAVQRRADECSGKTRARLLTVLTRGVAHGT